MPIPLNESAAVGAPVLRQQRIGETAILSIVRTEQRDRLRRNPGTNAMEPIPNGTDRNGRPKVKQEIVIHCLAMHGTTMEARIGEQGGVPAPGDRCRVILKAKGFGDWIEALRGHRGGQLQVGDVLAIETTFAQQYDQAGNAKGPKILDQATADQTPRGVTIGFYGPLMLAAGSDPSWIQAAESAYHADQAAEQQRNAIPLGGAASYEDADYGAPAPAYQQPPAPAPAYQQPPAPAPSYHQAPPAGYPAPPAAMPY